MSVRYSQVDRRERHRYLTCICTCPQNVDSTEFFQQIIQWVFLLIHNMQPPYLRFHSKFDQLFSKPETFIGKSALSSNTMTASLPTKTNYSETIRHCKSGTYLYTTVKKFNPNLIASFSNRRNNQFPDIDMRWRCNHIQDSIGYIFGI